MRTNVELIHFIELSNDEKKMVLKWRNHSNVKKWMYNTENILLENHLNFIKTLANQKDKIYFLVKSHQKYIGVIDFTNITSIDCEFGLYTNIAFKGYGKLLLTTIIEYAFNALHLQKLKAEVFVKNERAISLYKKYDFSAITKKIVNNREVLCMELKNENRKV